MESNKNPKKIKHELVNHKKQIILERLRDPFKNP